MLKIEVLSKMKAFADDYFILAWIAQFLFDSLPHHPGF